MIHDLLTYQGGAVKVLETKGDLVTIGGPAVVFDDPSAPERDAHGEFFTADTYFGARKGDGADVLFHHGFPIAGLKFAEELAEYIFPAAKVEEDEGALLASVVLDLRKEYERWAYERSEEKALGWSTGSAGHMVRKTDDGQITRWPIIEVSLTPTPAEKRTAALPLKSIIPASALATRALKAESLTARIERVYRAFYDAHEGRGWVAEVFDTHVIAELNGSFYRVPYSDVGQNITFADVPEWEQVERNVTWEPMKALWDAAIRPSVDPLAEALKALNTDFANAAEWGGLASELAEINRNAAAIGRTTNA